MTRVIQPHELEEAAAALRDGLPVGMPTETVYGLAADALNPLAVARVFAAKGRPADDPLIVHVSPRLLGPDPVDGLARLGLIDLTALGAAAPALRRLVAALWPGPLTLVLPRGPAVSDAITAGLDTVALRMPAHPVALALIDAAGRPLVAPSANRFGRISPTTADAVVLELDGRVPCVVDGGPCAIGLESTVLRLHPDGGATLLRPGRITTAELAALLGTPPARPEGRATGPQRAPGLLDRHYAPATPLVLVTRSAPPWSALRARATGRLGWLAWSSMPSLPADLQADVAILAPDGAPETAARRLYGCLRALDDAGCALLVVEAPPEGGGLLEALRDRLARAAAGTPPL